MLDMLLIGGGVFLGSFLAPTVTRRLAARRGRRALTRAVALPAHLTVDGACRAGRLVPEGETFVWVPTRLRGRPVVIPAEALASAGAGRSQVLDEGGVDRRIWNLPVVGPRVFLAVHRASAEGLRHQVTTRAHAPGLARLRATLPAGVALWALLTGLVLAVTMLPWATGHDVVARVDSTDAEWGTCRVGWSEPSGTERAEVDCYLDEVTEGGPLKVRALGWPFAGNAYDEETAPTLVVLLGGLGVLPGLVLGVGGVVALRREPLVLQAGSGAAAPEAPPAVEPAGSESVPSLSDLTAMPLAEAAETLARIGGWVPDDATPAPRPAPEQWVPRSGRQDVWSVLSGRPGGVWALLLLLVVAASALVPSGLALWHLHGATAERGATVTSVDLGQVPLLPPLHEVEVDGDDGGPRSVSVTRPVREGERVLVEQPVHHRGSLRVVGDDGVGRSVLLSGLAVLALGAIGVGSLRGARRDYLALRGLSQMHPRDWEYAAFPDPDSLNGWYIVLLQTGRPTWVVPAEGEPEPSGVISVRGEPREGGLVDLRLGAADLTTTEPVAQADEAAVADLLRDSLDDVLAGVTRS